MFTLSYAYAHHCFFCLSCQLRLKNGVNLPYFSLAGGQSGSKPRFQDHQCEVG